MTTKGQPRIVHDKEARISQAEYKYKNETNSCIAILRHGNMK